jgi:hypothetical protein
VLAAYIIESIAQTDYPTELALAGMPPATLPNLLAAANQVTAAEIQQEKFKRTRIKRTRLRIAALNALYKTAQQVIAAASAVYRTDTENRSVFVWEV